MTWYADDTDCDFFGPELAPSIHTIGWLDQTKVYETGQTSVSVYKSLEELLDKLYSPVASPGIHVCNLCQHSGETGSRVVLLPGNGLLYLFPDLILHYIDAHWYKPPGSFCRAVLECPPPDSIAYKKKLLANGGRKLIQNKVLSW